MSLCDFTKLTPRQTTGRCSAPVRLPGESHPYPLPFEGAVRSALSQGRGDNLRYCGYTARRPGVSLAIGEYCHSCPDIWVLRDPTGSIWMARTHTGSVYRLTTS